MARRRVFLALLVLAIVATAWLLFGRGDAPGHRAEPVSGRGLPESSDPKAPSPEAGKNRPPSASEPAPARRAPPAAASRIAVRVIDVDGSPAVGATVEAYAGAFGFLGSPRPSALDAVPAATTTTGRDGTASLKVAPGGYRVRAFRGGAANVPAHVTADGPEATLVLEPARALKGVVLLPEGAPARGYVLSLTFAHAGHAVRFGGATDDAGAFELLPLPDAWLDRLTAEVRPPDRMRKPDPAMPSAPYHWEFEFGREELRGGAITLQLTVTRLRARVVDEAGIPVPRAMVHWAPPSAPDAPSFRFAAVTDDNGFFDATLQRLLGEAFVIRAEGYAPLVWRPEALPADRKLNVPEIVLTRGAPLAGRVTDTRGNSIAGASVRLESLALPGQVVDQGATDEEGRFRFDVAGEHALYAFRPVEPDLCLPQLRMDGVRGGPDELSVVLPEPIHGTVRFVARGTGDAVQVEHLTLIVKDARGTEVAKRTWEPGLMLGQVRFEVWQQGTYDLEVYTAHHEPVRLPGVDAVRGRGPEVSVPLVPRR